MWTEESSIGNLFTSRFPLVIPKYQRAYAWEKEEVEDFTKDIMEIFNCQLANPPVSKKHFFGGIVSIFIHVPGTTPGKKHEIVDGQQRLATFFIALYRVKNTLLDIANEALQQNNKDINTEALAYVEQIMQLLEYIDVENGRSSKKQRLTLSNADKFYFQQTMAGANPNPTRESHRRIKFAYDKIAENLIGEVIKLSNNDLRKKLDNVLLLKSCLSDYCYVIHIWSEDKVEAYRLFSVLNDRGISLSDGDLLRSRTLELLELHDYQQDQVTIFWDQILTGKTSEIDKYLRTYYASYTGLRPPQRDLFDQFKNYFYKYSEPISDADADEILMRVENLKSELEIYNNINDGDWPFLNNANSQVTNWDRDRLKVISSVFRHSLCFPLLLSAAVGLDEVQFSNLVYLIEKFAFRYIIIMKEHPGGVENIYYKYAKQIRQNPTNFNINDFANDLKPLIHGVTLDRAFEQQLLIELDYEQSSKKKIIRYFLTTMESYSKWFESNAVGRPAPDKMIAFNFDQTTIEHIYPRNPQSQYVDALLETKKNMIGNLSIWPPSENGRVGNSPFTQKVNNYQSSSVRLNRWLGKLSQWTIQELEDRQQKLLDMSRLIYSI